MKRIPSGVVDFDAILASICSTVLDEKPHESPNAAFWMSVSLWTSYPTLNDLRPKPSGRSSFGRASPLRRMVAYRRTGRKPASLSVRRPASSGRRLRVEHVDR